MTSRFYLPQLLIPLSLLLLVFAGLSAASSYGAELPFSKENRAVNLFNREDAKIQAELGNYDRAARFEPTNVAYILESTRLAAEEGKVQLAVDSLLKAAALKVRLGTQTEYPGLIQAFPLAVEVPGDDQAFVQTLLESLREIDVDKLSKSYSSALAKPIYKLGLIAYRHNKDELVEPFWKTAVSLAPEWSYFYVELANLYAKRQQFNEAKDVLNLCLNFMYPRNHCQEFRDDNLVPAIYEYPGFLKPEIEKSL